MKLVVLTTSYPRGRDDVAGSFVRDGVEALRAGVVWVNCYDRGNMSSPFGGFKQSGFGRDKSMHAFDKYTDWKAVWTDPVTGDQAGTEAFQHPGGVRSVEMPAWRD